MKKVLINSIWQICISVQHSSKLNVLIWRHKWSGSLPNIFLPYHTKYFEVCKTKFWINLLTDARYRFEEISHEDKYNIQHQQIQYSVMISLISSMINCNIQLKKTTYIKLGTVHKLCQQTKRGGRGFGKCWHWLTKG